MNALEQKIEFYSRDIDVPHSVNGFRGTWTFSDHNLIPDILHEYLMLLFEVSNLKRVPLEDINSAMNEIWEGPGSLEKVFRQVVELRSKGRDIQFSTVRTKKIYEDEIDAPISSFGIQDTLEVEKD